MEWRRGGGSGDEDRGFIGTRAPIGKQQRASGEFRVENDLKRRKLKLFCCPDSLAGQRRSVPGYRENRTKQAGTRSPA